MATGGAGGGAGFKIAGAFVELTWRDAKYYQGLARAQQALARFVTTARTMGGSLNFAGATASIAALTIRVGRLSLAYESLAHSIRAVTRAAGPMNAALGGSGAAGLKALGQADAARMRAAAAALATQRKAAAQAEATGVRAVAAALGQQRRSEAAAGASIIRAEGAVVAGHIRAAGSVATGTIRAVTAPLNVAIRSLASVTSTAMRGLSVGGLLGGGLSAYSIAHENMKQETRSVRLARVTGGSPEEITRLDRSLKGLAATLPGIKTDRLYAIAEIGARMGIESAGVGQFAADMAKLGVVLDEEELPLEDATNRIGSLLSVFKKGTTDAIRFGSALVKLDQMSTATARDILDVTSRFSGPAAMYGMSPQQSLALATALRQARVPVETAGTSVGQLLMRMGSKKDMPGFAKLSGMSERQFGGTLNTDPLQAIKRITQGLAEINRTQGAVAASRALDGLHLDGQRVRGTLLQLAQVFPLLDKYVATANQEWSGLGAVMGGFNRQGQTAAAQITLMMNKVQLLEIEIGRAAIPIIRGFAEGIGNLATDMRVITERHGPQLEAFGKRIAGIFEYAGTAVRSWSDMKDLVGSFLREGLDKARTLAGNFFGSLLPFLGNAAKELGLTLGTAIAEGFKAGLGHVGGLLGGLFGGGSQAPKTGVLGAGIGAGIPNIPGLKFGGGMGRALPVQPGQIVNQLAAGGRFGGGGGIHVPDFNVGGFFNDLMAGVGDQGRAGERVGILDRIKEALGLQRAERGMEVGRQELQGRIGRMVGDDPAGNLVGWLQRNIGAPNRHRRTRRRTPDIQGWRFATMNDDDFRGRMNQRAGLENFLSGFDRQREGARQNALAFAAGGKGAFIPNAERSRRPKPAGPLAWGILRAARGIGGLFADPDTHARRRAVDQMPTAFHREANAGIREWRQQVNAAFTRRGRRIDASRAGFGPEVPAGGGEDEAMAKPIVKAIDKGNGLLEEIKKAIAGPKGIFGRAKAAWS